MDALRALCVELEGVKAGFASDKKARVEALQGDVARAAAAVDASALDGAGRAELALLQGRALDAGEGYAPDAERLLSAAVKLDPSAAGGWKALAHCLWKKADLPGARSCYGEALKCAGRRDADALRCLSMLLRQMPAAGVAASSPATSLLDESLGLAREALALDLASPPSWTCLGQAYLTRFFAGGSVSGGSDDLTRASQAYAKAAALEDAALAAAATEATAAAATAPADGAAATTTARPGSSGSGGSADSAVGPPPDAPLQREPPARTRPPPTAATATLVAATRDPDLHYNRGSVQRFTEDYAGALASFALADSVDPGLGAGLQMDAIASTVCRTVELLAKRAHAKPRRLRELSAALERAAADMVAASAAAAAVAAPAAASPAPASGGTPSKAAAPRGAAATPPTGGAGNGCSKSTSNRSSPFTPATPAPPERLRGRRPVTLAQLAEAGSSSDASDVAAATALLLKPLVVVPKGGVPPT